MCRLFAKCFRSIIGCYSRCFRKRRTNYPKEQTTELAASTGLTRAQIQHLYQRFLLFCEWNQHRNVEFLRKKDFLVMARLIANPLFPYIISSMFGNKQQITFVDFAQYLSLFSAHSLRTTQNEKSQKANQKIKLLFNMYDSNRDGRITEEDLLKLFHRMFADHVAKAEILNMVSIVIQEMDNSSTNQVLFEDFKVALKVFDLDEILVTIIPEL